jgi:high-affinity Fe2+/Pb2+ permease
MAVATLTVEYAIAGSSINLNALWLNHLPVALVEGGGTVILYKALTLPSSYKMVVRLVIILVLLLLLPIASQNPDALETALLK